MDPSRQYTPAAHLIAGSHLTELELVSHFEDFKNTLAYVSAAPELVFERLVANLSHSYAATPQAEPQSVLPEDHQADENLASRCREISSALEEKQLAYEILAGQFQEQSRALQESQLANDNLAAELQEKSITLQASQLACATATVELQNTSRALEESKLANENLAAELEEKSNSLRSTQLDNESHVSELRESSSALETSELANRKLMDELMLLKMKIRTSGDLTVVTAGGRVKTNPSIGTFNTHELRDCQEVRQNTSKTVTFAKNYAIVPGLVVGLTMVDVSRKANVHVKAYHTSLERDSFTINLDSWADTKLFGAACAWLAIDANDTDFQYGSYDTLEDHTLQEHTRKNDIWGGTPMSYTGKITFKRAYLSVPKVVVWLNIFDLGSKANWRIKTFATDVTANGFTIHIDTWSDTELYYAKVSWVSYPADRPGVASGSFNTYGVKSSTEPQLYYRAHQAFPTGVFDKPPRVFLALNTLNIDNRRDLRLLVKAEDVSATGMTWHLDAWSDTILHSAGASFIAFA